MLVEIFELAQAAALPPVSYDAAKGREGMGPLKALGLAENILAHGTPLFVRWTLTISCNRPILVRNRNVIVAIELEAITLHRAVIVSILLSRCHSQMEHCHHDKLDADSRF